MATYKITTTSVYTAKKCAFTFLFFPFSYLIKNLLKAGVLDNQIKSLVVAYMTPIMKNMSVC